MTSFVKLRDSLDLYKFNTIHGICSVVTERRKEQFMKVQTIWRSTLIERTVERVLKVDSGNGLTPDHLIFLSFKCHAINHFSKPTSLHFKVWLLAQEYRCYGKLYWRLGEQCFIPTIWPNNNAEPLVKTTEQLKNTVLWKFFMERKVLTIKWVIQTDIQRLT